jgi:hypothetical protein
MTQRISAVFDTLEAAQRARAGLLEHGIGAERIGLSTSLTDDGIAGEAPGHTYENQPGQSRSDSAAARYGSAMRSGGCVLTVAADSDADRKRIAALMAARGARHVAVPPA